MAKVMDKKQAIEEVSAFVRALKRVWVEGAFEEKEESIKQVATYMAEGYVVIDGASIVYRLTEPIKATLGEGNMLESLTFGRINANQFNTEQKKLSASKAQHVSYLTDLIINLSTGEPIAVLESLCMEDKSVCALIASFFL
jgi:hypothetical protein